MKKKKILIIILITMIVFLISDKIKDKEIYYVNINENYLKEIGNNYHNELIDYYKKNKILEEVVEFGYENSRIVEILNAINNNDYIYIKNKKHTIQNALIKADLLILEIGKNDLDYSLEKKNKEDIYIYLDTLLQDTETLLKTIRKYTKEKIILLEFKSENEYIDYFYKKLEKICTNNKIDYINADKNIKEQVLLKFDFLK